MERVPATRRHPVQRQSLWLALLAPAILLGAGCGHRPVDLRVPRGNLVLLSIDTTRADHLSVYHYHRRTTPMLEALARDAIVFDQVIAAAPSTAPSHMSMFTGLYPTVHGVMNFGLGGSAGGGGGRRLRRTLPAKVRTLAEILHEHGYATAGFTGGGNTAGVLGFSRGFDLYVDEGSGLSGNARGALVDPARALAWIRKATRAERPFFAFLHTYIPHSPYVPPPPFAGRYDPGYEGSIPGWSELFGSPAGAGAVYERFWEAVDRKSPADRFHLQALYDEEIHYADSLVETLFDEFHSLGLGDDTVFVITSDHGEQFGEHGEFEHHGRLWEELLRVPLLLALPSTRGRGWRVPHPVSGLELFPTLLDLLGLPPEPQTHARSLVPRLEAAQEWDDGRPLVSEFMKGAQGNDANGIWNPFSFLRSVRIARFKLIQTSRSGSLSEELYDLALDPHETQNRIDDPAYGRILVLLRRESERIRLLGMRERNPMLATDPSQAMLRQLEALGYVK